MRVELRSEVREFGVGETISKAVCRNALYDNEQEKLQVMLTPNQATVVVSENESIINRNGEVTRSMGPNLYMLTRYYINDDIEPSELRWRSAEIRVSRSLSDSSLK